MPRYIIDLNSFEVDAKNIEEAYLIAEKMLREDISLSFPFNVIELEEED